MIFAMLEQLVEELKKVIHFKNTTEVGDLVLVVAEKQPQMLLYALVTEIEPDTSRKEEWWRVRMQMLAIPPHESTWILRLPQFTGKESFTIAGNPCFVKAVDFGVRPSAPPARPSSADKGDTGPGFLRVVK